MSLLFTQPAPYEMQKHAHNLPPPSTTSLGCEAFRCTEAMVPEDAALVLRAHICIVTARCRPRNPSSAIPGMLQPPFSRRIRKCLRERRHRRLAKGNSMRIRSSSAECFKGQVATVLWELD